MEPRRICALLCTKVHKYYVSKSSFTNWFYSVYQVTYSRFYGVYQITYCRFDTLIKFIYLDFIFFINSLNRFYIYTI